MGFKTINLAKNLSSLLAMLIPALVVAVLLLPAIKIIGLHKIYQFLSSKLYFGFFLGLFMKSYMNIGICTILVIRKAYRGVL
jgi:hypothetical protein